MRRLLPASAIAAGLLMAITPAIRPGFSIPWMLAASAWILQGAILAILGALAFRIEEIARDRGLPGWVGAQADRNHRRMIGLAVAGSILAVLGAIGPGNLAAGWLVGGLAIGFNLGAIAVGSLAIAGQGRLRSLAETEADRLLGATTGSRP